VQTFSISVANTWEYKNVVFAGDTSGTWGTSNGTGIEFGFDVGSGSNFDATVGVWNAAFDTRTSGAATLSSTTSNNIYVTGVQFEEGTVATSFDFRDFGRELILCQRYYEKSYDLNVAPGTISFEGALTIPPSTSARQTGAYFSVRKRATPTMTLFSPITGTSGTVFRSASSPAAVVQNPGQTTFRLDVTGGVAISDDAAYQFTASAEL
jgi:hypothetical protein